MTDKLSIYNGILRLIGERKLASLTEAREPRRVLDDVWDGGLVNYCLEQGDWRFALRSSSIDYDPDIEPLFGLKYAFAKPDDWVRTAALCSDPDFQNPLLDRFSDEAGYWFTDLQNIYVSYVSNDTAYGGDMSRWPASFVRYVEAQGAFDACFRITQNEGKEDRAEKVMERALAVARGKDGISAPVQFPPMGSWAGARLGRYGARYRRGGC